MKDISTYNAGTKTYGWLLSCQINPHQLSGWELSRWLLSSNMRGHRYVNFSRSQTVSIWLRIIDHSIKISSSKTLKSLSSSFFFMARLKLLRPLRLLPNSNQYDRRISSVYSLGIHSLWHYQHPVTVKLCEKHLPESLDGLRRREPCLYSKDTRHAKDVKVLVFLYKLKMPTNISGPFDL